MRDETSSEHLHPIPVAFDFYPLSAAMELVDWNSNLHSIYNIKWSTSQFCLLCMIKTPRSDHVKLVSQNIVVTMMTMHNTQCILMSTLYYSSSYSVEWEGCEETGSAVSNTVDLIPLSEMRVLCESSEIQFTLMASLTDFLCFDGQQTPTWHPYTFLPVPWRQLMFSHCQILLQKGRHIHPPSPSSVSCFSAAPDRHAGTGPWLTAGRAEETCHSSSYQRVRGLSPSRLPPLRPPSPPPPSSSLPQSSPLIFSMGW